MKPIDTPNTPDGSIPTPGNYPLYEYPAYTFDKKYENDEFQKKVITLDSGYHLVLAPPGCGKTDILAERVVRALSCGVSLDDMLCLTSLTGRPEVCAPEYSKGFSLQEK